MNPADPKQETKHSRDAFELWIQSPPYEYYISRISAESKSLFVGEYRSAEVQIAWEAWQAASAHFAEMREALEAVTELYVGLVNSGDAGYWDPETTHEIKTARAILDKTKPR